MTHTPVPWTTRWHKAKPFGCVATIVHKNDRGSDILAEVFDPENVSVIQLAPTLLASLQEVLERAEYWMPDIFDDAEHQANCQAILDRARTLIALCEG